MSANRLYMVVAVDDESHTNVRMFKSKEAAEEFESSGAAKKGNGDWGYDAPGSYIEEWIETEDGVWSREREKGEGRGVDTTHDCVR